MFTMFSRETFLNQQVDCSGVGDMIALMTAFVNLCYRAFTSSAVVVTRLEFCFSVHLRNS